MSALANQKVGNGRTKLYILVRIVMWQVFINLFIVNGKAVKRYLTFWHELIVNDIHHIQMSLEIDVVAKRWLINLHWCHGKIYILNFLKFSCELLFVLFMQHIQTNTSLYNEIGFLFWLPKISIALAYANVDSAVTNPKPSKEDSKQSQAWKTLNRVCLMTLNEWFQKFIKEKLISKTWKPRNLWRK